MGNNTRREPRYPFIASAELLDEHSGSRMSSRISDLSFGGCYVDTINPLPDGTSVQLKIFTETHTFEAPATVVYSHTHLGMGMKFREVQPVYEEVLRLWLPEATTQATKAHA
jgi:PilZ domain